MQSYAVICVSCRPQFFCLLTNLTYVVGLVLCTALVLLASSSMYRMSGDIIDVSKFVFGMYIGIHLPLMHVK